jgi:hypothetical protein
MRLLVLTPSPEEARFAAASEWLERLGSTLDTAGVRIEARPWTDAGDLDEFDGVTTLMAWGYQNAEADWAGLLERLAVAEAPVVNGVDTLRWNSRETYLAQLEAAGAPVAPALFVDAVTQEVVADAHDRFGDTITVRSQRSRGRQSGLVLNRGDALEGVPSGPAMLQPFMPTAAEDAELSMIYFNGAFSHAVSTNTSAPDPRAQGRPRAAVTPSPEAFDAAERVLAAAGRGLTYARVDLIRDAQGHMRLMELEAIEPDLYLEHAPDGGAAFARAMLWALD